RRCSDQNRTPRLLAFGFLAGGAFGAGFAGALAGAGRVAAFWPGVLATLTGSTVRGVPPPIGGRAAGVGFAAATGAGRGAGGVGRAAAFVGACPGAVRRRLSGIGPGSLGA